jgi:hypothetical protein
MAKKAGARQPQAAPPTPDAAADANFVKVVRWICRTGVSYSQNLVTINGKPIREWALLNPDDRVDAFEVAIGLIAMRKAIDMLPPNSDGSVVHASDLLDALVDRTNSSASRFVYSIHLTHRGNPPASSGTLHNRAIFAGIVLALQEAAKRDGEKLSRKKAVERAKAKCRKPSYRSYTDQALKGWISRGEVPDADDYCRLIIQEAEGRGADRSFTSRVIDVARRPYLLILWRLPDMQSGL